MYRLTTTQRHATDAVIFYYVKIFCNSLIWDLVSNTLGYQFSGCVLTVQVLLIHVESIWSVNLDPDHLLGGKIPKRQTAPYVKKIRDQSKAMFWIYVCRVTQNKIIVWK